MAFIHRRKALTAFALAALQGAGVSVLWTLPLPAAAADAQLVPAQSEITFVGKELGVPLNGRFKRFSAQVAFDPKSPQTGRIGLQIDLGSVAVNSETDAELVKPEWFSAAKFPQASFQSTGIKAVGGGRFDVAGRLSIKGNARDVVVPVQFTQAGGLTTATGGFTLKRLDFKVGDGEWADTSVVADDVQVRFKFVLQNVPPM